VADDLNLKALDLAHPVREKLEVLEVRTLRQLFARLSGSAQSLRTYLELSEPEFAALHRQVEQRIREEFPEDALPRIRPQVHKRGVAVHRLADSRRSRFHGDD
jgi:hypothetical protein